MAQNPIGTMTDEDRLVPLYHRDGTFHVDVTDPIRTADVPESGTFAWRLRTNGEVPRLAFAPVDEPAEAGDVPTVELDSDGDRHTLAVPQSYLSDGLGLDTENYDPDNPLLFKPEELTEGVAVGMTREGEPGGSVGVAIELTPVRFDDGTPFRAEPVPESSMDSDPVAEGELARRAGDDGAPQSGTVSAPIDTAVVDEVVAGTEASRAEVIRGLESMSREGLVGAADDDSADEPLTVDDRAIVAVADEAWRERVALELDVNDDAVEAVREIHARQADRLLRSDRDEGARFEGRTPVVVTV